MAKATYKFKPEITEIIADQIKGIVNMDLRVSYAHVRTLRNSNRQSVLVFTIRAGAKEDFHDHLAAVAGDIRELELKMIILHGLNDN